MNTYKITYTEVRVGKRNRAGLEFQVKATDKDMALEHFNATHPPYSTGAFIAHDVEALGMELF